MTLTLVTYLNNFFGQKIQGYYLKKEENMEPFSRKKNIHTYIHESYTFTSLKICKG
jgi:hypothetical protein